MTRLSLLLISVVVGAAIAIGGAFSLSAVLNSSQQTPPHKTLYNYGQP